MILNTIYIFNTFKIGIFFKSISYYRRQLLCFCFHSPEFYNTRECIVILNTTKRILLNLQNNVLLLEITCIHINVWVFFFCFFLNVQRLFRTHNLMCSWEKGGRLDYLLVYFGSNLQELCIKSFGIAACFKNYIHYCQTQHNITSINLSKLLLFCNDIRQQP